MHSLYFPFVANEPIIQPLGCQLDGYDIVEEGHDAFLVPKRVYQYPARWMDCEAEEGVYTWTPWLENNARTIAPYGRSIIGTKTCPEWARLWVDRWGSPPREDCYDNFAAFLINVAKKCSPIAIEAWTEPDVPTEIPNETQYWYGAWVGVNETHYQAGVRYGNMLSKIYPIIKKELPNLIVIAGSLIGEQSSFEFLQGAVDGGLKADIVSTHKYIYAWASPDYHAVFDLIDNLRKITNIEIWVTETGLAGNCELPHQEQKAEYIRYLVANQKAEKVGYIGWYSMGNHFYCTDLLWNGDAGPAWEAFANAY